MVRVVIPKQRPLHLRQTSYGERYDRGSNRFDDDNNRRLVREAIAKRKERPFLWSKR